MRDIEPEFCLPLEFLNDLRKGERLDDQEIWDNMCNTDRREEAKEFQNPVSANAEQGMSLPMVDWLILIMKKWIS